MIRISVLSPACICTMLLLTIASDAQTGTWTNVTPSWFVLGDYGGGPVMVDPNRPSDIYEGSGSSSSAGGDGVIKSTDYGLTWKQINSQPIHGYYGFGLSPTVPPTILMGSGNGNGSSARSTDGGITFQITGGGLTADPYDYAVDPYDPGHILMGLHEVDGIAESKDTGRTFSWVSSVALGTPGWPSGGISWFPFFINTGSDLTTHSTWIAIAQDGASVCRTSNGGASWIIPSTISGLQHAHGWSQIFQIDSTLFVPGLYGLGQGVYRSMDLGVTWKRVDSGNEPENEVWGTPNKVYAAYGWACSGCDFGNNNYETASMPGTAWGASNMGAGTNGGVHNVAVTYDGTNYIFVADIWCKGLWRYVEPANPVSTSHGVTAQAASDLSKQLVVDHMDGNITIALPSGMHWELNLFSLSGMSLAKFDGVGRREVAFVKNAGTDEFVVARLSIESSKIVEGLICK